MYLASDFRPNLLREIDELCGRDVSDRIAGHFGGREMKIPALKRLTAASELAVVAGLENAKLIIEHLGVPDMPLRVEVPLGQLSFQAKRDAEIRDFILKSSATAIAIARRFGITRRTVCRHRRRLREEGLLK